MLKSKNVRIMLCLLLVCFCYTFVCGNGGCDDTASEAMGSIAVNKTTVRAAMKYLESSGFGTSVSAIGKRLSDAAGSGNASGDLYKKIKAVCVDMGLGADCQAK